MNEKLAKYLIELYALVASIDGFTHQEDDRIKKILTERLKEGEFSTFFDYFESLKKNYSETEVIGDVDVIKSKARKICSQIIKLTLLGQRFTYFSNLVQLIAADDFISNNEMAVVLQIGKWLNIQEKESQKVLNLITSDSIEEYNDPSILIISNEKKEHYNLIKNFYSHHFPGKVAVLAIYGAPYFLLRHFPDESNELLMINDQVLDPDHVVAFPRGSTLKYSGAHVIYYSNLANAVQREMDREKISFNVHNVSYKFNNKKFGIREISLSETEGKLVAIMGSSGSGKSTLLNVLNGSLAPTSGSVMLNGKDLHQSSFEGTLGYVPQDDLLIEDLTVFQNLYFAAQLSFADLDEDQIVDLVDKVLNNLGLFETKDLKVGSALDKMISGGQRKRLNIGLELLREPQVLFVDEPTSGLSSRDSENIMDLLKELTFRGKLIFVVIHQPSSDIFKLFDSLIFLDTGGYQVFYGNPVEAIDYFIKSSNIIGRQSGICQECGNVNPEQIFNILEAKLIDTLGHSTNIRRIKPNKWNRLFKKRTKIEYAKDVTSQPKSYTNIPNKLEQARIYYWRDLLSKLKNLPYLVLTLSEAPILAVILALIVHYYPNDGFNYSKYYLIYNENLPAYIFMSIIVMMFLGMMVSAQEIIKDQKIMKREAFLNLSRLSYISSKLLIVFGLTAFQSLTYVLIGNAIMEIKGMLFSYWLVLFSVGCFANALGLCVSSAFTKTVNVYISIPLLIIPQILLGGAMVSFDKLNPSFSSRYEVPIVGQLIASSWALEALMVTQFKDNKFEKPFYEVNKKLALSNFKTLYAIPKLETYLENSLADKENKVRENLAIATRRLTTLQKEISNELSIVGDDKFEYLDNLQPKRFNREIYRETKAFLNNLKTFYRNRYSKAAHEKDKILSTLTSTPEKQHRFDEMRKEYTNDQLSLIVTNKQSPVRIIRWRDRLVPKTDLVYFDPEPQHLFDISSHFYAPTKHFAGYFYPTLLFNVVILWIMSAILVVLLYFEIPRKLMGFKRRK